MIIAEWRLGLILRGRTVEDGDDTYFTILACLPFMAAPCIWIYQCCEWISTGIWYPQPISKWLGISSPISNWVGVQSIIGYVLDFPVAIVLLLASPALLLLRAAIMVALSKGRLFEPVED
jgi:hypothetical protein